MSLSSLYLVAGLTAVGIEFPYEIVSSCNRSRTIVVHALCGDRAPVNIN